MSSKYSVCFVFDACANVEVEANSPQEALDMAFKTDKATPMICNQCSHEVNLGDIVKSIVYLGDQEVLIDE